MMEPPIYSDTVLSRVSWDELLRGRGINVSNLDDEVKDLLNAYERVATAGQNAVPASYDAFVAALPDGRSVGSVGDLRSLLLNCSAGTPGSVLSVDVNTTAELAVLVRRLDSALRAVLREHDLIAARSITRAADETRAAALASLQNTESIIGAVRMLTQAVQALCVEQRHVKEAVTRDGQQPAGEREAVGAATETAPTAQLDKRLDEALKRASAAGEACAHLNGQLDALTKRNAQLQEERDAARAGHRTLSDAHGALVEKATGLLREREEMRTTLESGRGQGCPRMVVEAVLERYFSNNKPG